MNTPSPRSRITRYLPVAVFLGFSVLMSSCFMMLFASHPGGKERAERLRQAMDEALALYRKARPSAP